MKIVLYRFIAIFIISIVLLSCNELPWNKAKEQETIQTRETACLIFYLLCLNSINRTNSDEVSKCGLTLWNCD